MAEYHTPILHYYNIITGSKAGHQKASKMSESQPKYAPFSSGAVLIFLIRRPWLLPRIYEC